MIQILQEIVGLPTAASALAIAHAADRYSEELFSQAAHGDAKAQSALVEFHVAYLVWAYAKQATQRTATHRNPAATL